MVGQSVQRENAVIQVSAFKSAMGIVTALLASCVWPAHADLDVLLILIVMLIRSVLITSAGKCCWFYLVIPASPK